MSVAPRFQVRHALLVLALLNAGLERAGKLRRGFSARIAVNDVRQSAYLSLLFENQKILDAAGVVAQDGGGIDNGGTLT